MPTVEKIPAPEGSVVVEVWEEEWAKNLADAAIERVKLRVGAKQFQMFDLYVLQHWPAADVARVLGVSVGQVYLAKLRVGRLFRRELRRQRRER